jgi:hypothetical protein
MGMSLYMHEGNDTINYNKEVSSQRYALNNLYKNIYQYMYIFIFVFKLIDACTIIISIITMQQKE